MSDFHQHGPITTLHRLGEGDPAGVGQRLAEAARTRPITLVLPCHAEDLPRPAHARILSELQDAPWLARRIIVTNGGESSSEANVAGAIPADGAAAQDFLQALVKRNLVAPEALGPGKALNVWLGLGLALAGEASVIAVHDADISNYRRTLLARLCLPVADPEMNYAFAKGYYLRVTEGAMFGRVTRLFVAPFLRACLRVCGHIPLLDHVAAFRYPLAGECAFEAAFAAELPISPGWGLEVGLLCDVPSRLPPARICQVELGSNYEHKHRPLDAPDGGLVRMAAEIARTLLGALRREGIGFDAAARTALETAYERTSAEAVQRHAHDARMNALNHDHTTETASTRAFAGALRSVLGETAGAAPQLPAWARVFAQWPEARARLNGLLIV